MSSKRKKTAAGGTTTPVKRLSREALELVARRFRTLADPTRLQLVNELMGVEELTVQDLCERVGTSQANASKHLRLLLDEGVLARRKEGLYAYYSLADESTHALCELVCHALADRFERAHEEFAVAPRSRRRS